MSKQEGHDQDRGEIIKDDYGRTFAEQDEDFKIAITLTFIALAIGFFFYKIITT